MTESISTKRGNPMSDMFALTVPETDPGGSSSFPPPPPPPPMLIRPTALKSDDVSLTPPPLQRMSASNSMDSSTIGNDRGDNSDCSDSQANDKSLDSGAADKSFDEAAGSPHSVSDTNSNSNDQLVTPPPLRKCVASPDSKPRQKQATPLPTTRRVTERAPSAEHKNTIQVPDIDELLTDCAVATPIEQSGMVIDIASDDDGEFRPMRVSSKGRVVKKPSWADAYTDHCSTEMEEEGGSDWTPERPVRGNKLLSDSFKPRAPPLIGAASDKSGITHADLHHSMIMENPPEGLLLPLKCGWVRELVIRNPQNEELSNMERKHTNADTYYYAPKEYGSVKLRSLVKVQEFLNEKNVPELTSANFSFAKRALYKSPEEFVRLAGKPTGRRIVAAAPDNADKKGKMTRSPKGQMNVKVSARSPVTVPDSAKTVLFSQVKQIKTEFPVSPMTQSPKQTAVQALAGKKSPAAQLKRPLETSPAKQRPMIKKIRADKDATARARQFLTSTNLQAADGKSSNVRNTMKVMGPAGKPPASIKPPLPCTNHCKGVANHVPSVQCGVCLLLYHPECINWTSGGRDALFVCPMCILKSRLKAPRPVDKPVNQEAPKSSTAAKAPLINEALNKKSSSPTVKDNKSRLITIPLHVLNKIDTSSPFALKLNNETFKVNPSRLIRTSTGVKILIKNDQVMKPSEVEVKDDSTSSPVQMKQPSLLDIYQDLYKKIRASQSNSDSGVAADGSLNDSLHCSESLVESPCSEDMRPIITDVRTVSSESSEPLNSHAEPMDTSDGAEKSAEMNKEADLAESKQKHSSSQNSRNSTETEVANIIHLIVETVASFHLNQQAAKRELAKVSNMQASDCGKDEASEKQHRMNKPTDPRPNMPTPTGSMSEILYDQKLTNPKTHGRLGLVGEASSLLRSLVPKTTTVSAISNAGVVNVLSPQLHAASQLVTVSGPNAVRVGSSMIRIAGVNNAPLSTNHAQSKGVVLLPGKAATTSVVSSTALPIGPIILGPRLAPLSSGVKPVSLVSTSTCASLPGQSVHNATTLRAGASNSSPKILLMKNPDGTGVYSITSQELAAPAMSSLSSTATTCMAASKPKALLPSLPSNLAHLPMTASNVNAVVKANVCTQTKHTGHVVSPVASDTVKCSSMQGSISNFTSFYSCLLRAFSYLSVKDRLSAAAVCKMWRAVAKDPSLNKHLHFDSSFRWPSLKEAWKRITNETVSMRLDGVRAPAPTASSLTHLAPLSSLTLNCLDKEGKSWLSEPVLAAILRLPRLVRLSITGGMSTPTPLSTLSTQTDCAPLKDLTLHDFSSQHIGAVLDLVSRFCCQLTQSLSLQICASENNSFEEGPLDPSTHFACLEKFKHLQELELRYSRLEVDSCEAEYLKDTYTTLLQGCNITVKLYDSP